MLTKTLNGLWIAFVALTLMLSAALPAFAAGEWSQGFEVDTSGWFDESDYAGYGDASRVSSGTDGVPSSEGGFHAIFTQTGSGPFSRFDGYRDTWPGEWVAEIDVYLDPAAWSAGEGFDYSVAATANGGGHLQDFIFHVTKDTSTGDLMVGGSNNTNFDPREDLENINHYVVTSAGWYTLQHVFRDNAGVLEVDMNLVDDTDTVLFTETRSTPANLIPSVVGGNRYAWFTNIDVDGGIAVDNHELNLPADPGLEITDPAVDGEVLHGEHTFMAEYVDYDDVEDTINWALKYETCEAGTPEANVVGYSVPNSPVLNYDPVTGLIDVTVDMTGFETGEYCFVVNPDESEGPNFREVRSFYIAGISAAPEVAYNPVGTDHTITADVGIEVVGVDVAYEVDGANSTSGAGESDENGEVELTYSGGNPGMDTITVCLDYDQEGDCDEGEPSVEIVKYWLEYYLTGGGFIEETELGGNGKKQREITTARISFGGNVGFALAGEPIGNWQMNFHDVADDQGYDFDKGNFHATEITDIYEIKDRIICGDSGVPESGANIFKFMADGRFNGEDGWSVDVRVTDLGEPGKGTDGLLVILMGPDGQKYDSTLEFSKDEAPSCPNSNRSLLDGGNLQIHPPVLSEEEV